MSHRGTPPRAGDTLHALDHQLCGLIAGELRGHVSSDPMFAERLRLGGVPAALWSWLGAPSAERERSLLNDNDFQVLVEAVREACYPMPRARERGLSPAAAKRWGCGLPGYVAYRRPLPEIRTALATAAAEHFAAASEKYARRLGARGVLRLDRAIDLVAHWVSGIRLLLRDMSRLDLVPAPFGYFPTPTHLTPTNPTPTISPAGGHDFDQKERSTPPLERGNGQWLSNKKAAELEGIETRTLATYRNRGQTNGTKTFGVDLHGRIWRRSGTRTSHPYYFAATLRKKR